LPRFIDEIRNANWLHFSPWLPVAGKIWNSTAQQAAWFEAPPGSARGTTPNRDIRLALVKRSLVSTHFDYCLMSSLDIYVAAAIIVKM
jgi:hypothetical protein